MTHGIQMSGRSVEDVAGFIKERAQEDAAEQGCDYAEAFRKQTFRT